MNNFIVAFVGYFPCHFFLLGCEILKSDYEHVELVNIYNVTFDYFSHSRAMKAFNLKNPLR